MSCWEARGQAEAAPEGMSYKTQAVTWIPPLRNVILVDKIRQQLV